MSEAASHLLDANVLIALTMPEHEHHETARNWLTRNPKFTLCPITEGAMMRFMTRLGETPLTAQSVLRAVRALPNAHFIGDTITYLDIDISSITGHRQWTDTYLVTLASAHGLRLATFDRALATLYPEHVELITG